MNPFRKSTSYRFSVCLSLLVNGVLLFQSTEAAITGLILVDAGTNTDIQSVETGDELILSLLPSSELSFRAEVSSVADTSKVAFIDDATGTTISTERVSPYAIAGDSSGNFNKWNVPLGEVAIKIVQTLKNGEKEELTVTFTVLENDENGSGGATPTPSSTTIPTSTATPMVDSAARWEFVQTNGNPIARHEACFVMGSDGKGYLIGGRGTKATSVFDPKTNTWTQKTGPPLELHHMQCLVYQDQIWIGSAWTGGFPFEKNAPSMYVYDIPTDKWETKQGLPESRRRGGAAFVLHDNKMWLAMGNRGGHGDHATTLGWFDVYDPAKGTWTELTDAPDPRDHTSAGIVEGKLCVAGGRDGGHKRFFEKVVLPVNCYDFGSEEWMQGPDMPTGRAGAAAGTTCDGELMIAGGEGRENWQGKAFTDVSLFDGKSWRVAPPLKRGRHGSGLAITQDCTCGKIYIASGSGSLGGRPELESTEVYLPKGDNTPACDLLLKS